MKKTRPDYFALRDATILIVEDNESELEELGELFDIYFKKCFRAKDGAEGFDQFVANRPDIVLTDLGMPGMDGFSMAEKIRTIDEKVSIILHTIFADNDVFLKAIEYRISGYMIKPTNATLLLDILLKEFRGILKDREIKKEKMLMQAILEEFPDPIMVVDLDRNILFANNLIKKNKYWSDSSSIKCYQALYGYRVPCDKLGYECDSKIAIESCSNTIQLHENIDNNNKKTYTSIKTVPIKDENQNIYALLKVIQDKTADVNRERELKHLANYDILTNLPNRILLLDRLEQAIYRSNRNKICFALLFVDLDEFKTINDIYGHFIGDELLKEVSYRMKSAIRKIDTLARLGGDEFVVILENITDIQNILMVVNDILAKLRVPFELKDGLKVEISCSIGIEIFDPSKSCKSQKNLLQNADKAMYEAKKSGKDTYRFFEDYITSE